ncbi:hypothetical protein DI005_02035 [Prauserella sp. PE36]|uniref:Septum formation-related domain-containing protein n=1 Tax=Prauserella endophytica TaxID=1592324 RepID=A0ABY2SC41_9PSEU|nr:MULTISPECIES: septum formation family protein [Prauserella]RBM23746.1 hypothetical protein DI005_02035 [Prauserella sp. PE36]TKG73248.1 hypothetical protein FCN18_01275 [Prauserella endophytica]
MSRHGRVLSAAVLVAAVTLSACASEVAGTPRPAEPAEAAPPQATVTTAPRPSEQAPEPAGIGECVAGNDPAPVDCAQPHTVEITKAGTFGSGMPGESPDKETVFAEVFPECRQAAAEYLGSDSYDATTLGAWLLWAGKEDWKAGDRWYRCGVAQLDGEGQARSRTGSVRGILADERGHEFQSCSSVRPSQELPQQVPCDGPHTGEAIGTVRMGGSSDAFPSDEQFNAAAAPACRQALREYLGTTRDDVAASWRWPDQVNWRNGFTNVTCYAETQDPVTRPLRGIGSAPLPR